MFIRPLFNPAEFSREFADAFLSTSPMCGWGADLCFLYGA